MAIFIRHETKTTFACEKIWFQGQAHAALQLNKLLALNPQALQLRTKLLLLEAKLAAATASFNYPLIVKITAEIAIVVAKQSELGEKQKAYIGEANRSLATAELKARSYFLEFGGTSTSPNQLQVKPDIATDLAPLYFTRENFKERQTGSSRWKFYFSRACPEVILAIFRWLGSNQIQNEMKFSCGASLTQRGLLYMPTLVDTPI